MGKSSISVRSGPPELRVAVLALKNFRGSIRNDINKWTRAVFNPVWREEIDRAVPNGAERVLKQGARIQASNPPRIITASTKRRATSKGSGGGLIPVTHWPGFEYGTRDRRPRTYTRVSPQGVSHQVRRVVVNHLPSYTARRGRYIGPTVRRVIPRIASGWSQYVIKQFMDALEKGANNGR